jgi:hypothetical protein
MERIFREHQVKINRRNAKRILTRRQEPALWNEPSGHSIARVKITYEAYSLINYQFVEVQGINSLKGGWNI